VCVCVRVCACVRACVRDLAAAVVKTILTTGLATGHGLPKGAGTAGGCGIFFLMGNFFLCIPPPLFSHGFYYRQWGPPSGWYSPRLCWRTLISDVSAGV